MSKSPRKFSDLREKGSIGVPEAQKRAQETLASLSHGMAGDSLKEFLSSILLEVCPEKTYEALLEDRGRKALAQELLNMLIMDGQKNEDQKQTSQ